MLTGPEQWKAFRYLAALVGVTLGLGYGVVGLGALFVSTGRMTDLVTISTIFFVTLPGALVGVFAPRIGGWAIIAAGLLAATCLATQETEALGKALLLYIGPSVVVGIGLVVAALREGRTTGAAAYGEE